MYDLMIFVAVVIFGGCFFLSDTYRKMRGSSFRISMESALVGSLAGIVFLTLFNGFALEFTPFTLVMALATALNSLLLTFFSFRALSSINLSLYSVFCMLGGMALPFVQGVLFYEEQITCAKIVCVTFICAALALTVKWGEKSKAYLYYAGVFVLNGMSGVLSKLFHTLPFERASVSSYSLWCAICTLVLSGIATIVLSMRKTDDAPRLTLLSGGISALGGGLNQVANFLLVLALAHVDSSVQYPAVTGGVMIVSTVICYFGERKPSLRELASVALAFIGTLALFVIPI